MENQYNTVRNSRSLQTAIRDGFQVIQVYPGHKRIVLGCSLFSCSDDNSRQESLISWDSKCICLWEGDIVIRQIRFPKSQEGYISCIEYIPRLNVFFAPCLDMTFKIYDRNLKLLDTIQHKERAIISLAYDSKSDILILSGALGLSVWKISRSIGTSNLFVLEKLFKFVGCEEWISRFVYDRPFGKLYGVNENTVWILDIKSRSTICKLIEIHDASVVKCCWYPQDQFLITGCARGLIKCWALHNDGNSKSASSGNVQSYTLLSTIIAHSKAITGLSLHPIEGLLLTAGMDGYIKVFSLETFQVVNCYNTGEAISYFTLHHSETANYCLFAQSSGNISLWKIESCTSTFCSCEEKVVSLEVYERLNISPPKYSVFGVSKLSSLDEKSTFSNLDKCGELSELGGNSVYSTSLDSDPVILINAGHEFVFLTGSSGNDFSRLEPEQLIEDISFFTYSVLQRILFCIIDNGYLRLFSTKGSSCTFIRDCFLGALNNDKPTALTLVDCLPLTPLRSSSISKDMRGNPSPNNIDETLVIGTINGCLLYLDTFHECAMVNNHQLFHGKIRDLKYRAIRSELLVLGENNGNFSDLSLKILKLPHVILTHELYLTKFSCWAYSFANSFVAVGCQDGLCRFFSLLNAPITEDMHNLSLLRNVQSDAYPITQCTEIMKQDGDHAKKIVCIAFCDALKIFVTASVDFSIKLWDFDKTFIRTIFLNRIPTAILFANEYGDLFVSQGNDVVKISREIWYTAGPSDMGVSVDYSNTWEQHEEPQIISNPSSNHQSTKPTMKIFLTEHDTINKTLQNSNRTKFLGYWSEDISEIDLKEFSSDTNIDKYLLNVRYPRCKINIEKPQRTFVPLPTTLKSKLLDIEIQSFEPSVIETVEVATLPIKQTAFPRKPSSTKRSASPASGRNRHAFISIPNQLENVGKGETSHEVVTNNEIPANFPRVFASVQQRVSMSTDLSENESYFLKANGPLQVNPVKRTPASRHRKAVVASYS